MLAVGGEPEWESDLEHMRARAYHTKIVRMHVQRLSPRPYTNAFDSMNQMCWENSRLLRTTWTWHAQRQHVQHSHGTTVVWAA